LNIIHEWQVQHNVTHGPWIQV